MSTSPVYINLEFTPNPNTLKYSVNRVLVEKGARKGSTARQNSCVVGLADRTNLWAYLLTVKQ
ncbi:hypothetical protein EBZ37_10295, partial [bacterium]|nr:hypothetical protein [bacterium]